jgi:hypothetical protein
MVLILNDLIRGRISWLGRREEELFNAPPGRYGCGLHMLGGLIASGCNPATYSLSELLDPSNMSGWRAIEDEL